MGTCILLQNPTWFLISCCRVCSAVYGLTAEPGALETSGREGGVCTTQQKARGGAWISTRGCGAGSCVEMVPLGALAFIPH